MVECLLFTMAKTIKRNFVYNLLLQISAVLFPIITAPYIARVLDRTVWVSSILSIPMLLFCPVRCSWHTDIWDS